jgi:hypothetical protein
MSTPPANIPAAPASSPNAKFQSAPAYLNVLTELDVNRAQLNKRQELIRKIEAALSAKYGAQNRLISYVFRFGHARTMIHSSDIASLDHVLRSVSGAEQINVLIHSPGGDGSIIEKMVDMCRSHLAGNNQQFRVIVPNIAKSAATVFALGADKIVMGYCSELGPIDPQVPVVVSGVTQWISAFAFVESRDHLLKEIREAEGKKAPTTGLLQQLAGLNTPFTLEMENLINFAEKTATRLLGRHMLKTKITNQRQRTVKAKAIAKKLLSKQVFPVHGHFINATTARDTLELEVEVLDRGDALWELIWEYYLRCEVQMNIPAAPNVIKTKLFESADQSLIAQDTAN